VKYGEADVLTLTPELVTFADRVSTDVGLVIAPEFREVAGNAL
jgi:hypothetical protein